MREVQVGDKLMRLKGSPLSLLYYRQAFDRDFLGDFAGFAISMFGVEVLKGKVDVENADVTKIDTVILLRMIWVLNRTAAGPYAREFPSFEVWVEENEEIDVFDRELMKAAMEEAKKAFFRSGAARVAPAARR